MIKVQNIFVKLGENFILKNINFEIHKNEKVFVIGSSGAGKTTLINTFLNPNSIKMGDIIVDNTNLKTIKTREIRKLNSNYGFISQKDFFINWETVFYNIKNLYSNYKNRFYKFFNFIFKADKNEIFKIAKKLKIQDILFKKVSDISGGEKQRIKILLLLIQKPKIIFADEPTSSLDIKISREIIKEIYSWKNALVILNIHKIDLIPSNAKRIIGIKNGSIIFDGSRVQLTQKIIKKIYE